LIARVSLPARFSFDAVVRSHGWYGLPPFAYDRERGTLQTVVETATGAADVTFRVKNGKLEARGEDIDSRALRAVARRVFSLDLDFAGAHQSLASAPELARALDRRGGRMLRAPTLFEDAVKILFTTNCSWEPRAGWSSG
jgi:N-glycosylase/DNA lyase